MKSDLTKILALLLAVVSAPVATFAQGEVSMRLDIVGWGDEISGLTLGAPGGTPFTAHAFRYSKALPYSGPAVLEIYQSGGEAAAPAAPLAAGEATKLPTAYKQVLERRKNKPGLVALAALPVGSKRATVLLLPAPGGIYMTHVLDDDPSKLPVGRLRIHNLSPLPLAIRTGGKDNHQLPLHGSCTVAPVNQELLYELAYQEDDEWKVQENNLIPVADDEQTQMVVLKSDSSYFSSSNGSRGGYLQIVFLRRLPREAEAMEITQAEREAAAREAARLNAEMEEAAKPENGRKKPKEK
jgi:hypothetical protein